MTVAVTSATTLPQLQPREFSQEVEFTLENDNECRQQAECRRPPRNELTEIDLAQVHTSLKHGNPAL